MELTPIGFGAWAIGGGDWQFSWGPQDDNDSIAAIHRALDLGINWIDTAAVYGLGHSEEVVARALKGMSAQALRLYQVLAALARGQVDLQLAQGRLGGRRAGSLAAAPAGGSHRPLPGALAESRGRDRRGMGSAGVSCASRARSAGSEFRTSTWSRWSGRVKIAPITSLQPPYSMLRRAIEAEILPYAQEHGIGVINYSPMVSGLLTGKMTAERVAAMPADDWRRKAIGVQRAAVQPQPAPCGAAARDRRRARRDAGRCSGGVDSASSRDYGSDCGRTQRPPGGRDGVGARLPAQTRTSTSGSMRFWRRTRC